MSPKSNWIFPTPQWLLPVLFLMSVSSSVLALPTSVLSNFNQPVLGSLRLTSLQYVAVPFTTDSQFTQLDGVEINATTLLSPGNVFVQIWNIDNVGRPNSAVATLSGPSEPAGLTQYVGTVNLQPDTSYFMVIGVANGAGSIGNAIIATDGNQADTLPPPIYRIGTDFDGDGSIDFVNKCRGTVTASGTGWSCGGIAAVRFFPEFRILAEEPVPTPPLTYSLTSAPLSLDFGLVPDGSTSAPLTAVIENDGNVTQVIGAVSVGTGFALAGDGCSGTTLAPGATCSIDFTFTPVNGGTTAGTAIIPAASDPRSPYGLTLTGESDQPSVVLPPVLSDPKPVPLRFTLLTAFALLGIAALRLKRMRKALRNQSS